MYGSSEKITKRIEPLSLLGSAKIGSLIITKGIVVRVSDIKPQIAVATYTCEVCGCENYQ